MVECTVTLQRKSTGSSMNTTTDIPNWMIDSPVGRFAYLVAYFRWTMPGWEVCHEHVSS